MSWFSELCKDWSAHRASYTIETHYDVQGNYEAYSVRQGVWNQFTDDIDYDEVFYSKSRAECEIRCDKLNLIDPHGGLSIEELKRGVTV